MTSLNFHAYISLIAFTLDSLCIWLFYPSKMYRPEAMRGENSSETENQAVSPLGLISTCKYSLVEVFPAPVTDKA